MNRAPTPLIGCIISLFHVCQVIPSCCRSTLSDALLQLLDDSTESIHTPVLAAHPLRHAPRHPAPPAKIHAYSLPLADLAHEELALLHERVGRDLRAQSGREGESARSGGSTGPRGLRRGDARVWARRVRARTSML